MPHDIRTPGGEGTHLVVALSPHGYGHGAMTAPVVAELRERLPGLAVTLQTSLPAAWLRGRYAEPFRLVPEIPDFGLHQTTATEILVEETAAGYRALHAGLDMVVAREAERLRRLRADLVLSNVAYVPLLAARAAGVPAIAMSCLNWADIYGAYFRDRPEGPSIEAAMLAAYGSAAMFLRPAPAMPMARLPNLRPIGPLARRGVADAAGLRRRLGVAAETRIGLIAFGGMPSGLSFAGWPRLPGWHWVITADPAGHPQLTARDEVAMSFVDLLASCDVVVTKPGYSTFAEAAVNGRPVLCTPRPNWPESPFLVEWLERHGRCLTIDTAALFDGDALAGRLQMLFSLPAKPLVEPSGVGQAVAAILPWLQTAGACDRS